MKPLVTTMNASPLFPCIVRYLNPEVPSHKEILQEFYDFFRHNPTYAIASLEQWGTYLAYSSSAKTHDDPEFVSNIIGAHFMEATRQDSFAELMLRVRDERGDKFVSDIETLLHIVNELTTEDIASRKIHIPHLVHAMIAIDSPDAIGALHNRMKRLAPETIRELPLIDLHETLVRINRDSSPELLNVCSNFDIAVKSWVKRIYKMDNPIALLHRNDFDREVEHLYHEQTDHPDFCRLFLDRLFDYMTSGEVIESPEVNAVFAKRMIAVLEFGRGNIPDGLLRFIDGSLGRVIHNTDLTSRTQDIPALPWKGTLNVAYVQFQNLVGPALETITLGEISDVEQIPLILENIAKLSMTHLSLEQLDRLAQYFAGEIDNVGPDYTCPDNYLRAFLGVGLLDTVRHIIENDFGWSTDPELIVRAEGYCKILEELDCPDLVEVVEQKVLRLFSGRSAVDVAHLLKCDVDLMCRLGTKYPTEFNSGIIPRLTDGVFCETHSPMFRALPTQSWPRAIS